MINNINSISISDYHSHDREIVFNDNDVDLKPIYYKLPAPPKLSTIDNFGLPIEEQYFKRPITPPKLLELQKQKISDSSKVGKLESIPDYYAEEIEFILREYERAEKGYWFFNKGQPTYISNYHYLFLTAYHIQSEAFKLPYFSKYDRKFFLFADMCLKDPFCFGFNFPKHRRGGASSMATCIRLFRTIFAPNQHGGLQSMDLESAKTIHQNHLVYAWEKLPFWYSPIWDGDNKKTTSIRFFSPRFRNSDDYGKDALESEISYKSATEGAYDGDRLTFLHNDEVGKTVSSDIYARWGVQKPALKSPLGFNKAINTSTVEEMDAKGGKNFKKLCDESDYHKKDTLTKQTTSGLYTLFIPGYEKLADLNPSTGKIWTDKYGDYDEEAEAFVHATAKQFELSGNLEECNNEYRRNPCRYRDCWRPAAKNSPFNLQILHKRLDIISLYDVPLKKQGDFEWHKGLEGKAAFFRPDPNGRFFISWDFQDPKLANSRYYDDSKQLWCPGNTHLFIAGCDNFGFRQVKGSRKSNAGFAIKYKLDLAVDDVRQPRELWKSDRFICTYKYRTPTPEEAADDWMKACCYFGCELFPELNLPLTQDRFVDNGFGGYLYYEVKDDGKREINAGDKTDQYVKELIFARYQSYVDRCGVRCCHDEILEEIRDIYDPAQMVDFDLFTAGGYALIAEYKQTTLANINWENTNLKPEGVIGESLDDVLESYTLD